MGPAKHKIQHAMKGSEGSGEHDDEKQGQEKLQTCIVKAYLCPLCVASGVCSTERSWWRLKIDKYIR